jgi:hypothetical protein
METFKITLRIVYATATVLNTLLAINKFLDGPAGVLVWPTMFLNLIGYPLFVVFIFVLLYNCIFKRTPVSFFKTELIYFLIWFCVIALLNVWLINRPTYIS